MRGTILVLLLAVLATGCVAEAPSRSNAPTSATIDGDGDEGSLASAPEHTWAELVHLQGGGPQDLVASFSDPEHGWLATWNLVLATSDGGRTWLKRYESDDLVLRPLAFVLPQAGFAAAGRGLIPIRNAVTGPLARWSGEGEGLFRTTDGGRSWQQVGPDSLATPDEGSQATVWHLAFVDERHGWAQVGPERMLRTTDGGASWSAIVPPCPNPKLGPVPGLFYFLNRSTGWMVCWPGSAAETTHLQRTRDGGDTWEAVGRVPVVSQGPEGTAPPISPIPQGLFFLDEDTGWLVQGGGLFATRDGGRTWRYLVGPPGPATQEQSGGEWPWLGNLHFFSQNEGLLVYRQGQESYLLRTGDGGASWTQLYPPAPLEGLRPCLAADLVAGITMQAFSGRRVEWTLHFENGSPTACVLRGRPSVAVVDAAGKTLMTGSGEEGSNVGSRGVILHPGQRAGAALQWQRPYEEAPAGGIKVLVGVPGDERQLELQGDAPKDLPSSVGTGPFVSVDPPYSVEGAP